MKKLFVTLIFAGFISFIPSSLHPSITSALSAQIPSDGLVAWYPFNGNANDESGNGNHGVVNGATLTTDRFGNFNGAYSFNGISQYIGLQGTQMIDFSDGISFSAWIKADELRMASIVDKEEYCSSQGYRINTRSNSEIWAEHSCYGSQISGANTAKASSSYSVGLWYHIVGTLSLSNGNSIYVNGQLIQNVPVGITVNNLKMIEIGKSTLDQGESFKGIIDNIAIYNRALSSSEIQQLYQDQTGQVAQPCSSNPTIVLSSDVSANAICEGGVITLTATITDGGQNPVIEWLVNGVIMQSGISETFIFYPLMGDVVSAVMTPSVNCPGSNSVQSNPIVIVVIPFVPPNISIISDANDNTICDGGVITFTASATNAGVNPTFEWLINGVPVPLQNSEDFTSASLSDWDEVSCIVTSSELCAVGIGSASNVINVIVIPSIFESVNATILEGETYTLGTQTLTTAGTYTEVFTSANGCDSTVTLTLAVEPLLTCELIGQSSSMCDYYSFSSDYLDFQELQMTSNIQSLNVSYLWSQEIENNFDFITGSSENKKYVLASNSPEPSYIYCEIFTGLQSCIDSFLISEIIYADASSAPIDLFPEDVTVCNSGDLYGVNVESSISDGEWLFSSWNLLVNGVALPSYYSTENSSGYNQFRQDYIVNFKPGIDGILQTDYSNSSISSLSFVPNEMGDVNIQCFYNVVKNGCVQDLILSSNIINIEINSLNYAHGVITDLGALSCETSQFKASVFGGLVEGQENQNLSGEFYFNWYLNDSLIVTTEDTIVIIGGIQDGDSIHFEFFQKITSTMCIDPWSQFSETIITDKAISNYISIIEGESYSFGLQTLTTAGTYTEVFTSAAGCDSTVTLTLSVEPLLSCEVNSLGQEICIGEEIDIICSSNYISNGNVPSSIDGFLGPYFFNGHSYFASIDSYYWIDAKNLAQQSGGYLVIPNDSEETNFLVSQVFSEPTTQYIGISDELVEGNFVDVFGDALTFQNWSENEPNNFMNNNEDYVEMYFNGLWNDLQGGPQALQWPFVIEFNSQIAAIAWSNNETTPTITVTPTQTTTYTATVTTATQTCTDSITITVNPLLTWYADADADGFGNPDDVVQDCNQPNGYISDNTDCNDADGSSYPNAEEICFDQVDNNCNGTVDENCAIFGCTIPNACNFDPQANTNDGSCILPQPETCNGLDDNCNGQVDEGFSIPSINAASATPALYPTCTGNALKSANLLTGTDSPVIAGSGPDLWYSFTAQYNTLRVGLSAAFGDNSIGLYTNNNGCLELISEEHEVYTASTTATGNQILLTDQLTVGQTYYVAVHQITGPANASAKVCFTYLNESSCDHYYSNNTGVYTNVCNSFKAQYRANATNYLFNVLSGTQNGVNMNLTPWTYTNNNSNSVVARLGSILPANHSGVSRVYTLSVPTVYGLTDAAGNVSNLVANATSTCTVTLNSEATIALRQADRCPTNKSLTSTIAPDRTVCGAMRYDWEFTQVLPTVGTAQVVQGGAYASVFFLSNVPGITAGKTYNVRVRPVHSSGITGNWGAVQCLRVGSAGMVMQSESESDWSKESRVSSISIYPNPTATGSFVLEYIDSRRGEWTFAPDATMELTFAQEPATESESAQELVMMDITGKVVFKTNVVLSGNIAEIQFGDLESGLYLVDFGGERSRVQVMK